MASQAHHEMDAPKELCAPRNVVPQERENVLARLVKPHLAVAYAMFLSRFENSQRDMNYGHLLSNIQNPPPHVGGYEAVHACRAVRVAGRRDVGRRKFWRLSALNLETFSEINEGLPPHNIVFNNPA